MPTFGTSGQLKGASQPRSPFCDEARVCDGKASQIFGSPGWEAELVCVASEGEKGCREAEVDLGGKNERIETLHLNLIFDQINYITISPRV